MRLLGVLIAALAVANCAASEPAAGFVTVLPLGQPNMSALDVLLDRSAAAGGGTLGDALLRLSMFWRLADHNRQFASAGGSVLSLALAAPGGVAAPLTDKQGLPFTFNATTDFATTVAAGINVSNTNQIATFFVTIVRLLNASNAGGVYASYFTSSFATSAADDAIQSLLTSFAAAYGAPTDRPALHQQFGLERVTAQTMALSNYTGGGSDGGSGLPTGVIVGIVAGGVAIVMVVLAYVARRRSAEDDEAFAAKYGRPVSDGQSPLLKHYRDLEGHGRPMGSPKQTRHVQA